LAKQFPKTQSGFPSPIWSLDHRSSSWRLGSGNGWRQSSVQWIHSA